MSRLRDLSGAPWAARYFCTNCAALYRSAYSHPTLGPLCPICLRPVPTKKVKRTRTASRLQRVAARDGWLCHLCGQPINPTTKGEAGPTVDHVLPLSLGGGNEIENLRLAHAWCNHRRGNRPLAEGEPVL